MVGMAFSLAEMKTFDFFIFTVQSKAEA
jgi:hypothetical protein